MASVDELRRKYGLASTGGTAQQASSTQSSGSTGSTQSKNPVDELRAKYGLGETTRRNQHASQKAETPAPKRASAAPVIPEAEQRRQSERETASTNRANARTSYTDLRNTRDSIKAKADDMMAEYDQKINAGASKEELADEYAKIMKQYGLVTDYDQQVEDAYAALKQADQEYKDVYADYNAARQEVKAAKRNLRDVESQYAGWATDDLSAQNVEQAMNNAEDVKDARTRLANAREAYIEQGGNPDANIIGSNAKSWGGQMLGTARYMQDLHTPGNEINVGPFSFGRSTIQGIPEEVQRQAVQAQARRTEETAARLQRESAEEINSMKAGRSELGQFGIDVAGQGVQMGLDAATGKILPGGSLTAMALRTFGSSAQEAKDAGATLTQQGLYGAGAAAVEVLTEKMFDGLAGIYGAGAADDIVSHAVGRFTQNRLGQAALGMVADAAGEGLEEVISDLANPVLRSVYDEHVFDNGYFGALDGEEILYDFLVGAAMGMVGGSVEGVTKATGLTAEDERSKFFMQAGQDGMKIGDAMRMWQKHLIKEGYATQTGDQSISNRATELEKSIDEKKFDPFREQKINRLNQQAATTIAREDMRNTLGAVEQRMQQLGEENGELAEAITMVALEGEAERIGARDMRKVGSVTATEAQHRMVEASPIAQRILSEMDVENLRGEQQTEAFNAFAAQMGASDEDLQRNLAPYQRSNEWVKKLQGNKALASDVYGTQTTVTAEEKASVKVNGEAAKIVGAEDGKAIVEQNGERKTVNLDEIEGIGKGYRQLVTAAANGTSGEAMLRLYKPGQNVDAYAKAWNLAENVYGAQTNISYEEARGKGLLRELTDNQLKSALELGRERYDAKQTQAKERSEQFKAAREKAKKQGTVQRKKGTVSYDGGEINGIKYKGADRSKFTRQQKKVAAMVEAMADAVNLDYMIVDGEKNTGGCYIKGGVVVININSGTLSGKTLGAATLSHELTHHLQDYAPEQYQELKDFIVAEILKQSPEQFNRMVQRQLALEPNLSYDQATDEMIANACQTMLLNSKAVEKLARQNMTLAERITDWISETAEKIKAAFEDVDLNDNISIYEPARAIAGVMDEVQELWDKALLAANENYNAEQATGKKKTAENGGVQNMAWDRPRFEKDIDRWILDGKKDGRRFFVGTTSAALQSIGVTPRKIHWLSNSMNHAQSLHPEISDDVLKQVPDILERPIIVMASKTQVNRLTMLGEVYGENGIPVMAVLALTPSADGLSVDSINLVNAYTKTQENGTPSIAGTQTLINESDILYVDPDKKRTDTWLDSNRLQLPFVAKYGPIKKITLVARDVNGNYSAGTEKGESPVAAALKKAQAYQLRKTDTTGKDLTKGQQSYFADSKIRDEEGRLKVMYRGGASDITVFDRRKSSYSNLYGRGFYFTDSESHASQYGKAHPYYLNITNPLQAGAKTFTSKQIRAFLEAVAEDEDYGLENYGYGATVSSVLKELKGKDDFGVLSDINATCIGDLVAASELFNEVNGTNIDGIVTPTETVAFRSDQIKEIDNENPTRNPDTRFQMFENTEETDKLVAVHNKSVSGLRRMLQRGGVPFPSIAIKKAGAPHEGFGDISIVFPRSTIDPQVNRQNRLYSNDAWTPTEPRTEFEVDVPWKLKQKLEDIVGKDIFKDLNGYGNLDDDEVAKALADSTGNIFEALKRRNVIKYAYLKSIGQAPEVTQREADLDGSHKYKNAQLLYVFDHVPADEINAANWESKDTLQKIADALNEQFESSITSDQGRAFRKKYGKLYSADDINIGYIKSALFKYQQNGNSTGTETDTNALSRALMDNTAVENDPGFKKWIEDTFNGVVKNSGIPNGKDPYTSSGNRRSFKQTHMPATLENIVAQMQKQNEKGIGLFGVNLRGAATKTYSTVEQMRAETGKLLGEHISDDVYKSYMDGFHERLHNITRQASQSERWESMDSTEQILLETLRDANSKAQMGRMLDREAKWIKLYPELTDELWQLKQDVQNMPAPYFEAKPRRIVYPEEALAYILPDNADADVLQALEQRGYNVLTYKAGDSEDRLAKLNSVEGAQFQKWGIGETEAEQQERKESFDAIKAQNKILKARADYWRGQTRQTKENTVRQQDTDRLANELLREYESKTDKAEVKAALKELGDWLVRQNGDSLSYDELYRRARSIAEDVIDGNYSLLDNSRQEDLDRLKDFLKGTAMNISSSDWRDTGDEGFRKKYGRYFTVSENGRSLDSAWGELEAMFGEGVFPEDVYAPGDMLNMIADYLDMWKPQYGNEFEQNRGEAVEWATGEIIDRMLSEEVRQTPATYADKAQQKLNAQIARDRERLETLRAQKNARIEQIRRQAAEKNKQIRLAEKAAKYEATAKVKQHYLDMLQRQRETRKENAGQNKYRAQVKEKAATLQKMLQTNSDKLHVPEVLKAPLAEFLSSIDFSSKSMLRNGTETQADRKFQSSLAALSDILSRQERNLNGDENADNGLDGYLDMSQESMDYLREMTEEIHKMLNTGGTFTVNSMTAEQLQGLSKLLSNITSAIRGMNNFLANERYATVREAADADIKYMDSLGSASDIERSGIFSAVAWKNGTPYYVLKRFGKGGAAIFESFTKGWEQMARNIQEVMDFTQKTYTDKEVKAWKNETHEIELSDGSKIQMTTAQIMAFSVLTGREQAMKHIEKGGIRIGDIKQKVGKRVDTKHYHLTVEDMAAITGTLTARQAEVAKKLQHYMALKGAAWGNEVSMRRFGYNFYDEGDAYFPIRTDSNDRGMQDTDAVQNSMFRLLNLSASKSLNPKASNALIVDDIFDVFADHMSDMAKLNGMGLPILDAIKWFNYKERIDLGDGEYDTRTLMGAMDQAFGDQAQRYFRTLMKDINGVSEAGDRGTDLVSKLMGSYKAASVGANLRVALLQPTSYVRASALISPQYLLKAFTSKNAYKEALENSGTALWKSLGYYDTNISRGMREQIKHDASIKDQIVEKSMTLAELGDRLTWGRLWVACKMQTKAQNPKLTGQDLINKTADLFRETIYATQVMDSTLTRSELMRGKSLSDKAMTSFMAEPTLSYNMLMDAASDFRLDVREKGSAGALQRNAGKITRAFSVYAASAAFAAVVESLADAVRDDDEDDFWQKFLDALFGEKDPDTEVRKILGGNLAQDLTILGKLPYLKSFISTLQGYKSKDMSIEAFNSVVNAAAIWKESIMLSLGLLEKPTQVTYNGNMTTWGKISKTLQALSQLTGLPGYNMTRDATALWNTMVGDENPELKVKTYRSKSERIGIYFDALREGDTATAEQFNPGYASEKDEQAALKGHIREMYLGGEAESKELVPMLMQYGGMTRRSAEDAAQQWKMEVDTGIKFGDLQDAYLNGDVSRTDAVKYYRQYSTFGHTTQAEAEAKVLEWQCEKDTGIAYSDIDEEVKTGRIGKTKALAMVMKYGGKSEEAADKQVEGWLIEHEYNIRPSELQEEYMDGNVSVEDAFDILVRYKYNGKEDAEEKAYNEIVRWNFIEENPGTEDITVTQIQRYQNSGLEGVVDGKSFLDAYEATSIMHGVDTDGDGKANRYTRVDQQLAYIDGMDLTSEQKTSLALALGINEKSIRNRAPWNKRR